MALPLRATVPTPPCVAGHPLQQELDTMDSSSSSDSENEHNEPQDAMNVQTMTEGLLLLKEFASLDSLTYQSSFSFPKASAMTLEEQKCRTSMQRLEQLQQQNSFQNTPLPALWLALHRLHSNLAILQENEAKHAAEVMDLREELKTSMRENHKLRKACRALTEQNRIVNQKLVEKRSLLKQARDLFRSSQEIQKDLQEQNAVFKLQAHEQVLTLSGRIRLESSDSNFSDADALLFPDNSEKLHGGKGGYPSELSPLPAEGEEDLISLHSSSSSITEDGVPVLKLVAHDDMMSSSATANSSHYSDMSEGSDDPAFASHSSCHLPGGPLKHPASPCMPDVYKLKYPYGQKTGLRFQCIPLHEIPLPPKGLLTQDFLKDEEGNGREESKWEPFRIGSSNRKTSPKEADTPKVKGRAFIVAGYDGVPEHAEQLPRPTLGARVIEIHGQAVDPEWSMRKFMDVLQESSGLNTDENASTVDHQDTSMENSHKVDEEVEEGKTDDTETDKPKEIVTDDESSVVSSIGDKKRFFFMCFRNDSLSKRQRERLASVDKDAEKASANQKKENTLGDVPELPSDAASKRESKPFGLGFLRLGGDKASHHEKKEESKSDEPKESSAGEKKAGEKKEDRLGFLRLGGNHDKDVKHKDDHSPGTKKDGLSFLRLGGGGDKTHGTDGKKEQVDEDTVKDAPTNGKKEDSNDETRQKETSKKDGLSFLRLGGGEKAKNGQDKTEGESFESTKEEASDKKKEESKDDNRKKDTKSSIKKDGLGFLRLGGGGEKAKNGHDKTEGQTSESAEEEASDKKETPTSKGRNPLFFWDRSGGDKTPKQKDPPKENDTLDETTSTQ